jgi:cysteine desulfuration protein SufE
MTTLATLDAKTLLENFRLFDDWEARYAYVIDLGKSLPPFPETEKTDANIVRGCTSQVWLTPQQSQPGHVAFLADSDAHIVRGLIAILTIVYNHQSFETVRYFDIEGFFDQLGLSEHLSPNRRNGFFAMVQRIKALAD